MQTPQPDLYSRLFEPLVFPLLDRFNGTSIRRKLHALLDGEHLDRQEIVRRQQVKLAHTVAQVRAGSGFYPGFWQGRRGPASAHPELDGLPVVTKADLKAAADAFPEPGLRGRVISSRTSGSTGSPMVFHRSAEQESWFWALRFRIWRWAGYQPGDPYLTINLNPRLSWKKKLQDRLFRCSYLTFNADNQNSQLIVDTLRSKRIPHLNGFSSSLYVLARYMLEHGIGPAGVRGITATGDGLYPAYREAIEEAFGVRVLDYYGAGGEGLHLASQCPESGSRLHLHPENAVVEILGPDGPQPPGERGRLVVTQLDNEAMPLIRYELGDVAVAAPDDEVCACGRTLPMLAAIEGRVPDLIVVPDGTFLVTHFFVVLFKNLQSVHRYQIHQREAGKMVARLVARPGCDRAAVEDAVLAAVAEATRGRLETRVEWVEAIGLSGAGKRRLVISELSRQLLAGDASSAAEPDP